jgi:hypothetical protein
MNWSCKGVASTNPKLLALTSSNFDNALWFTFHNIFQKIIWPIWICDLLNVHVCTPQYQCNIMIKHHISIFITQVIVLPLGSQVVQTNQKPWYEFKQFSIIVSINGMYHKMNIYIIKCKSIIISMNNMIILFDLWLIIIILRFCNKIYNIKFVINSMHVSVFWQ